MDDRARWPSLALRIGITGHRWREPHHAHDERLDPQRAEKVRHELRRILVRIRHAVEQLHREQKGVFSDAPPVLSLISALAEGADELAAAVAVEPTVGYVLDVVAPYDLSVHGTRCAAGTPLRAIWDQARARLVLDGVPLADLPRAGETAARNEATLIEVNRRLVWNSDLVIAIWDGKPARGEAGTANVITRARLDGLPVIHIDATHPSRITVLDADASLTISDDGLDVIDALVARLLIPPAAGTPHTAHADAADADESSRTALNAYQAEQPPGWIVRAVSSRVYKVALRVLTFGTTQASLSATPDGPDALDVPWHHQPMLPAVTARRTAMLDPAFRRADYFATSYGARHRSTFTTILFAAPLAVACAWFGTQAAHAAKLWWFGSELALLLVLLLFYFNSRRLRFHERLLDYRLLAERLRHLGFLWPLGRSSPVVRVPAHAILSDPRPAWVNWWYRAITRQLGLAAVTYTPDVVDALRTQVRVELVAAQAKYNAVQHGHAHNANHWVHALPWIPLGLALVAATAHVLEHWIRFPEPLMHTLTPIGIVGPAFGAALHGFASQAGFQEIVMRTDASEQQLERFATRLDAIDVQAPLASAALGALTLELADMLGADLAGWRVDYLTRPVNPPG